MLAVGPARRAPSRSTRKSPTKTKAAPARWRGCARAGRWPTQAARRSADLAGAAARRRPAPGSRWPTKFSPIAIIATTRLAKATDEFDALANDPNSPQQLQVARPRHGGVPQAGRRQGFRHRPAARAASRRRCLPRPAPPARSARHSHDASLQAPALRLRARGCLAAGRLRHAGRTSATRWATGSRPPTNPSSRANAFR